MFVVWNQAPLGGPTIFKCLKFIVGKKRSKNELEKYSSESFIICVKMFKILFRDFVWYIIFSKIIRLKCLAFGRPIAKGCFFVWYVKFSAMTYSISLIHFKLFPFKWFNLIYNRHPRSNVFYLLTQSVTGC